MTTFTIDKESNLRSELRKYINLIQGITNEQTVLLDKHAKAAFGNNKLMAQKYLLRISANNCLIDAYKLCIKSIELEVKGV